MTDLAAKAPCALCSECSLAAMPFVPSYVPSSEPKLIIVGEAPGYHEERLKTPLIGPSGKLLDAVLEHIEIDSSACFKTNAVLCRPPNNDLSKHQDALRCCAPRLEAELAALQCEKIVALGATAVQALDAISDQDVPKNEGILKRRGNWYKWEEYYSSLAQRSGRQNIEKDYLATLHPAFVLRSAGYMAQFLQDMRSIVIERGTKDWLNIPYYVVGTAEFSVKDFYNWLSAAIHTHAKNAFDVETANLSRNAELLALGIAINSEYAVIVPAAILDAILSVRERLAEFFNATKPIAHNAKFDQQVLKRNGIPFFPIYGDTMLAHYAIDEMKGTHGLKTLATSFLGVPDYERELIDKHFKTIERDKRDYSKIPLAELYQYLAIDCCATFALNELLEPMIEADNVAQAYQILIDGSNMLVKVEDTGIKIDRPYLELVNKALETAIAKAEKQVKKEAAPYVAEYLANRPSTTWDHIARVSWIKTVDQYRKVLVKCLDINLNSWQQLQVLLYDVLELKHTKRLGYKTDPRSTNVEALDALEDHPFVSILKEFRRLAKIKGTYVEKLLELADSEDRVHISFNLHGTETGRLSANDGLHGYHNFACIVLALCS